MNSRPVLEILPGVYQLGGYWGSGVLGVNVFLLVDENLTLVDTGFRGRIKGIINSVRNLGYSLTAISRIVVTHHHLDHTGNLARLRELTGAEIIAHYGDVPYIEGNLAHTGLARPAWLSRYLGSLGWSLIAAPAKVDRVVNDGDELPVLGGIRVVHTPGHTPGSICLWLRSKKVLIVGDVLAHRFGLRLPSLLFTADIAEEIHSVNKIAGFDFDIICFGHGSPITKHARDAVAKFAARINKRFKLR
jgi:glyoxylase-like metal-dependent hydrolase (beta-lactamase superfamily II)